MLEKIDLRGNKMTYGRPRPYRRDVLSFLLSVIQRYFNINAKYPRRNLSN